MNVPNPSSSRSPEWLPVADIQREPQLWHIRTGEIEEEAVDQLAGAVRLSGEIAPITVVRGPDGGYVLGVGLIRLLAAERLNWPMIPAYVLDAADPIALLRAGLAHDDTQTPYSHLERGWAVAKLRELRQDRGLPVGHADLGRDARLDRFTVSAVLQAASAVPRHLVREVAEENQLPIEVLAGLPRATVRVIAKAPATHRKNLLISAAKAHVTGGSPTRAVREAVGISAQEANIRSDSPLRLMVERLVEFFIAIWAQTMAGLRSWFHGRGDRGKDKREDSRWTFLRFSRRPPAFRTGSFNRSEVAEHVGGRRITKKAQKRFAAKAVPRSRVEHLSSAPQPTKTAESDRS